jgi:hypothetical protein
VVSVPGRLIKDENCNYVVVLATRSHRGKKESIFIQGSIYLIPVIPPTSGGKTIISAM